MKNLNAYLERVNKFNSIFGIPELVVGKDNQRIADKLDSDLSPENLTCDGELSRSAVQAKYKLYTAAARELKAIDPSVTFYEFN